MLPNIDLGNGLVLGPLKDECDASQFINLHQTFTGEGAICDRLIHQKRDVTLQNFFVVKDSANGKVVSTTCLLPWVVDYAGIPLNAAMLEMVITHPDYRQKGLVRAQLRYFQNLVKERGFEFSIIQGIPYYYRQFGYGYSLDQDRAISLPTRLILESELASAIRFRLPQPDDFVRLTNLYQATMAHQQIYVQRSQDYWEYLIHAMGIPLTIIESENGAIWVGYFWGKVKDGILIMREHGVNSSECIPAILAKIKIDFPGEIQVFGNQADPFYQAVEALGGVAQSLYQWLINVPVPEKLLSRIGPVLEKRLIDAGLNHLSTDLLINFYREAVSVAIKDSRIVGVENRGFVDTSMSAAEQSDLCIPPDAFVRLVFGYRSLTELRDAWPDLIALPQSRQVIEVLFPPMSSLILMPY